MIVQKYAATNGKKSRTVTKKVAGMSSQAKDLRGSATVQENGGTTTLFKGLAKA